MSMANFVFDLPFARAPLPDLLEAQRSHVDWLRRFGMVDDPKVLETFLSWAPDVAAARFYPKASKSGLQPAVDLLGWMIIFDGPFDGPLGAQPEQVAAIIGELVSAIGPDLDSCSPRPFPAAATLYDLWRRLCRGMSASWRQRAAINLAEYLNGPIAEAASRANARIPAPDVYLQLRRCTGGTPMMIDMAEPIIGFEVPEYLTRFPILRQLHDLAVDIVDVVQDVLSLSKEETDEDPNNMVLVLEAADGGDRSSTLDRVAAMVRNWTDTFLRLESHVPAALDELNVAMKDRTPVYQWIDALRGIMRGNHDWCVGSVRYVATPTSVTEAVGYFEGIFDPARLPGQS
jgi:hypothetical protein